MESLKILKNLKESFKNLSKMNNISIFMKNLTRILQESYQKASDVEESPKNPKESVKKSNNGNSWPRILKTAADRKKK